MLSQDSLYFVGTVYRSSLTGGDLNMNCFVEIILNMNTLWVLTQCLCDANRCVVEPLTSGVNIS